MDRAINKILEKTEIQIESVYWLSRIIDIELQKTFDFIEESRCNVKIAFFPYLESRMLNITIQVKCSWKENDDKKKKFNKLLQWKEETFKKYQSKRVMVDIEEYQKEYRSR